MMQSYAMPQPFLQFRAIGATELEPFQGAGQCRFLILGGYGDAREILGTLRCLGLAEVYHVDRCLPVRQQLFHRLGKRYFTVGKLERHRARGGFHDHGRTSVDACHLFREELGVAQSGGHE